MKRVASPSAPTVHTDLVLVNFNNSRTQLLRKSQRQEEINGRRGLSSFIAIYGPGQDDDSAHIPLIDSYRHFPPKIITLLLTRGSELARVDCVHITDS